ncbi:hypothetical protein [Variovorax boronicumulans]|uniref:hypothetical protein n=1 Tax=Variovorax boronicumulans TaxID=436515 RepID=UPI0019808E13|nr:hypothetical protein [Variovorax boronicumulans]
MGKKPAATTEQTETAENGSEVIESSSKSSEPIEIDLSKPTIRAAIDQGKVLIAEGKSKADAARAIFDAIKDEPKDVIVAAFVEGATLTDKGALTYWYNVRRKAAKDAARKENGTSLEPGVGSGS